MGACSEERSTYDPAGVRMPTRPKPLLHGIHFNVTLTTIFFRM